MRLFFALGLNKAWKDELENIQDELWESSYEGRATARENLHLTVAFLGDVPDYRRLIRDIDELSLERTILRPKALGSFKRSARELVFLELQADKGLIKLSEALRSFLDEKGFSYDRKKFRPHITLMRRAEFVSGYNFREVKYKLDDAEVTSLLLISSKLGPQGPSYETIKELKLK